MSLVEDQSRPAIASGGGYSAPTEEDFRDEARLQLRDRLISQGLSREDAENVMYPPEVISVIANQLAEQHSVLLGLIEQTIDAYDEGTLDELSERWRCAAQPGD